MLRSSISNTRKFFEKTLESFKSFFSNGYQKLPKSHNNTTAINKPLCTDLTLSISQNINITHNPNIIIIPSSSPPPSSSPSPSPSPSPSLRKQLQLHAKQKSPAKICSSRPRIQLFRQKLEEIEAMIDVMTAETDHVSDVQEFLHYYSRLRCPAYLDIVEQFFMEMCSEFLVPQLEPPRTAADSRRRKKAVGSNRH